jgi:hypothetical protein
MSIDKPRSPPVSRKINKEQKIHALAIAFSMMGRNFIRTKRFYSDKTIHYHKIYSIILQSPSDFEVTKKLSTITHTLRINTFSDFGFNFPFGALAKLISNPDISKQTHTLIPRH